jgi:hypothetical protein
MFSVSTMHAISYGLDESPVHPMEAHFGIGDAEPMRENIAITELPSGCA